MGTSSPAEMPTIHRLIAQLWSQGESGRESVSSLLAAIEEVAPDAVERAYARQVTRRLKLSSAQA